MKYIKLIAVAACFAVLPSCSLLNSASRLPSSLMQAVARSAGLTVSHEGSEKTELEKGEEEANVVY